MAPPAYLVCFISTFNSRIKKKPWKPGARTGHITNLKQCIFGLSISMIKLFELITFTFVDINHHRHLTGGKQWLLTGDNFSAVNNTKGEKIEKRWTNAEDWMTPKKQLAIAGNPYWRGRISTVDYFVWFRTTAFNTERFFFYKTSNFNEEAKCTEASPSGSILWLWWGLSFCHKFVFTCSGFVFHERKY